MKSKLDSSKKTAHFLCTVFAIFLLQTASSSPDSVPSCGLNFTSHPYEPSGECINGFDDKIDESGGIPRSSCCRNALYTLSQALAWQATTGDGSIFIQKDQWEACDTAFNHQQQSVSIKNCRFSNFFQGSSQCSALKLSNFTKDSSYQDALHQCSSFNPSFNETCKNCTAAFTTARDKFLNNLSETENKTENFICTVALITAIAAGETGGQSVTDDFFRCLPALNKSDSDGYIRLKASLAKAIVAILLATTGMMLVIMLIKNATKHNKKQEKKQVKAKEVVACSALYTFSKAEIEKAINYGSERKCLGRGSAGVVYKGVLPSGQVVAIKHIHETNTTNSFSREIEGLSRVRHPNLVGLFGYCIEDGEQYLVYEYCSAGNLAQHLLKKETVLTWEDRVKILRNCALALRYLHHYGDGCIVHRDIKLTNILLTEKLEPKLSDFGLAKVLAMEESKVYTDVRGTIGYMDPEYMSNAKLTCASDIYSFGIVALQVLSGQKVIELDLEARDQLTRKARDVSIGRRPLKDFEDPRMQGNLNVVDFESILQLAVLCVAKSSDGRPSIDIVFEELDKALKNTQGDTKTKSYAESSLSRSIDLANAENEVINPEKSCSGKLYRGGSPDKQTLWELPVPSDGSKAMVLDRVLKN
ncbi:OLC1v1025840C1 [Oldenlandia corymbosa var. corymbosa]|uniref:OLC1v1025840C1 n=1 Tax=Oldenlandia corymbosa var. corymbosa TaxID=529605 RepID=A0AAV1C818_OLDCO|nr:OLC1v1025840C1 [Oldenlandia corymbosa var. corymbosa]